MKKVFLLFGITSFALAAAAQQKDIFDIQQHLLKKQSSADKKVFQQINIPVTPTDSANLSPIYTYTLANGDVIEYGNGRIPCVKPDMSFFLQMPNVAGANNPFVMALLTGVLPGQIPNGAIPGRRLLPGK